MKKSRAQIIVGVAGLAAIVAFFLPFLDVGGLIQRSGWDVVMASRAPWTMRLVVALVPVGGIALLMSAFTDSKKARWVGLAFGLSVLGYLGYTAVKLFFATTGLGLWVTIAAAIVAIGAFLVQPARR